MHLRFENTIRVSTKIIADNIDSGNSLDFRGALLSAAFPRKGVFRERELLTKTHSKEINTFSALNFRRLVTRLTVYWALPLFCMRRVIPK